MKFIINEYPNPIQNTLIYREDEYSFGVTFRDGFGFTSILINLLQLDIEEDGVIKYLSGHCPLFRYEKTKNFPDSFETRSITAVDDKPLIPGVCIGLTDDRDWPTYINKKEGWVCLGNPVIEGKKLIEFAPNCVASLVGEELVALWLHPESLPSNIP